MRSILISPLYCGICLLAATGAMAQTIPAAMDRAPGDRPMLIDDFGQAPGNIPEIIRTPENTINSRAIVDPYGVLAPPEVDPMIFASGRAFPR